MNGIRRIVFISIGVFFQLLPLSWGQTVSIDKGQIVNDLWVFPSVNNPNHFYYLPNEAGFGKTKEGLPEFSMMRYVTLNKDSENTNAPITNADGGAILHFLVRYGTTKNQRNRAEQSLRNRLKNEAIIIKGPVIFDEANLVLVSSIIKHGQRDQSIVTVSSAPVLEGAKLAMSFRLEPKESKLLLESFKIPTADVSITFELKFSGYAQSYKAEIEADWEKIYEHSVKKKSRKYHFHRKEAIEDIKTLTNTGAVKLTTYGEDPNSEKLISNAYEKILNLVYAPININEERADKEKTGDVKRSWRKRFGRPKDAFSLGMSSVGSNNGYQYRKLKKMGRTKISLNKANKVQRFHMITFNFGDLYEQYGKDERLFKTVHILDPDFMQRKVFVSLDGSLRNEFKDLINAIHVRIKKQHKDGKVTNLYLRIDSSSFDQPQSLVYPNRKDFNDNFLPEEVDRWMEFNYQVTWDFEGGASWQTEWKRTDGDVNLYTPYAPVNITLVGDLNKTWEEGYKAVVIDIRHDFFGQPTPVAKIVLQQGSAIEEEIRPFMAPIGDYSYEYRITKVKDNEDGAAMPWIEDNDTVIVLE